MNTVKSSSVINREMNKILVFRSANVYQTARALDDLRAKYPRAEITLLLPRQQMEYLVDNSHVDRLRIYDEGEAGGGAWKSAMRLMRELREDRFDLVVILCPSPFKISHLYDVILFSLFIPARRRILLDGRQQELDLNLHHKVRAVIDSMLLLVVSSIAKVGTYLLLAICPNHPRERKVESSGLYRKPGRIAILVPVLPDMSHTFVYREILAMIEHGADVDVIALEEGDYGVLHPEAKELLAKTLFVPKISFGKYSLLYLSFLMSCPRRMAQLVRMYLPFSRGDKLLFLRFEHFHNLLHPMQSFGLASLLKKRGIGCIHSYGSTYPSTRAVVASLLLDIPFSISTFVDFDRESDFRMLSEKVKRATFIVATTRYCASRLASMLPGALRHKIHTILLSIDPDYGIYRMQHPARTNPMIVSVGRLVEKKGFDYLLKAMVLLKARGVSPRCVLIGDGPERTKLHAMVKSLGLSDCVTFTGALPNDKVLEFFGSENILVSPSVYARDGERDGIPTVLTEALLCEMPVVSTRISGIPELVEDGLNGILVPERDECALADAIQKLLENPELRKEYGRPGREKVQAEFNVGRSSQALWSLIQKNGAALGHG